MLIRLRFALGIVLLEKIVNNNVLCGRRLGAGEQESRRMLQHERGVVEGMVTIAAGVV